jgi:hypothetical protein
VADSVRVLVCGVTDGCDPVRVAEEAAVRLSVPGAGVTPVLAGVVDPEAVPVPAGGLLLRWG